MGQKQTQQPHGFQILLTENHCKELDSLKENVNVLTNTLTEEYRTLLEQHSKLIEKSLLDGKKSGYFRDAVTEATGKPYLNWDFNGNRSRYWRMLILHLYQQTASRINRKRFIELLEETGEVDWEKVKENKIQISPNEARNILAWHRKGNLREEKLAPVPLGYSATDSSMIKQTIKENMVEVELKCVRKEPFKITYQIPPHIVAKHNITKLSKPVITISNNHLYLRDTVYTEIPPKPGENILGVDLGKIKPFSATAINSDGYYSQELICSKELERIKTKIDRIQQHKNNVYDKIERIQKLEPNRKLAVLETEYVRLRNKNTTLKEHLSWLSARDITTHAVSNNCGTIRVEDLSWLDAKGGKWQHSTIQQKLEHVATCNGVTVEKVDSYNTSWEFPEEYETNPAPKASFDYKTRLLTSPKTGEKVDKDRAAGVAIACRPRKSRKRGERDRNRQRVIQPKRCRDKHHATPKRPKNKPKTRIEGGVSLVSSFPRQVSVVAGVTVEKPVFQVANNVSNKTVTACPFMSHY